MAKIDILMATYNGGKFLPGQLESILRQTFTDWRLLIRDDGSTDNTAQLLEQYQEKYPDRIQLIRDEKGNLGPLGNFNLLMETSDADYCAFSDQDDLWKPEKLEHAFQRICQLEMETGGGDVPLMVFADREIVDAEGNLLVPSYWRQMKQHPKDFPDVISHFPMCIAAGSTMLINRALRSMSLPIPTSARMHDTWIELVAAAFGKRAFLDEVALSYRRHAANVSGSENSLTSSRNLFARMLRLARNLRIQRNVYRIYFEQAEAFLERFGDKLDPQTRKRAEDFVQLRQSGVAQRAYRIITEKLAPVGWERKLTFILLTSSR